MGCGSVAGGASCLGQTKSPAGNISCTNSTNNKSVSSDRRKIWKHAMAVGDYRVYSLLASFHQEQPEVPQEKAESVPDQPVEEANLCSAATWED